MKKLLLLLLCLILTMSMFLTSCKKDDEDDKDDEGSSENGGNQGNQGGNEGGNEGNDPETPACSHVGTVVCEKCGEVLYTFKEFALPEITSLGAKLTEFEVVTFGDPVYRNTMTVQPTEAYVALDENGALKGYGSAVVSTSFTKYERNETMNAVFFIENNVIYLGTEGSSVGSSNSLAYDEAYMIELEKIPELKEAQDQLADAQPMLEQYAPVVMEWLEENILPILNGLKLDGANDLVNSLRAKFVNNLLKVTANNDGTATLSFNFDTLKTWNQALKDNKLNVVFDAIVGEGAFAKLEALAQDDKLYNLSVADVLNYLKTEQGVDPAKLLDAVDALMVELMGEGATLETVLGMPEGTDFGSYLEDETILAMSVKDALVMLMTDPEAEAPLTPEEAVAEAKAAAAGVFAMIKEMTAYDLIMGMSMGGGGSSDEIPEGDEGYKETIPASAEIPEDPMQETVDYINGMIDMVADMLSFSLTADANKVITGAAFAANVNVPDATVSVNLNVAGGAFTLTVSVTSGDFLDIDFTVTGTKDKITIAMDQDVEDEVEVKESMEIIPNLTVEPDAAKVAALKAQLAKADGKITYDNLKAYVENYREDYNLEIFKVLEGDGVIYKVVYRSHNTYGPEGEEYCEIYYNVYVYNTECYGYMVAEGCTGAYCVSPTYQMSEFGITIDAPGAELSLTHLNDLTVDAVIAALEDERTSEYHTDSFTPEYVYKNGELISYDWYDADYGHTWVENEAKSKSDEGLACESIWWTHYDCSVCGKSYKSYNNVYHRYDKVYEGNVCKNDCKNCDEAETITINFELPVQSNAYQNEFHDRNNYDYKGVNVTVTFDETTAGSYTVYTKADDYADTKIVIFSLSSVGNSEYADYIDECDNGDGDNGCDKFVFDFEAGQTYIINVYMYGFEADSVTLYAEKN